MNNCDDFNAEARKGDVSLASPSLLSHKIPQQLKPIVSTQSRVHRPFGCPGLNPKSKASRHVGRLARIMDMPLDIFIEIAVHLDPRDILNLSRLNKRFRSILMSKQSRYIWITSRKNVPGLPDCPSVLSEPKYVSLVFDRYCLACGVGRSVNVNYGLGVRFCKACYRENVKDGTTLMESLQIQMSTFIYTLLPRECVSEFQSIRDALDHTENDRYCKAEFMKVARQYVLLAPDASIQIKFVEWRRCFVAQMAKLNCDLIQWEQSVANQRTGLNGKIRASRNASIIAKLRDLGYIEQDLPQCNKAWRKLVNQPKELTPRIWDNIRPKLETLIQHMHESYCLKKCDYSQAGAPRIGPMGQQRLHTHYLALVNNTDFGTPLPNFVTFCDLAGVKRLLDMDDDSFYSDQTQSRLVFALQAVTEEHILRVKRWLACKQWSYNAVYSFETNDWILARASSLFFCACHRCPSLPYPNIYEHFHAEHPLTPWTWNHIYLERLLPRRILVAVGLPEDTSLSYADELVHTGRLYCFCGDPRLPPPANCSWAALITHIKEENIWYRTMSKSKASHITVYNDHDITSNMPCYKLLSPEETFDSAQASVTTNEELLATITTALRANGSRRPSCYKCLRLVPYEQWSNASLPRNANMIAYHMRAKHHVEALKTEDLFPDPAKVETEYLRPASPA
ncbi:hypothetical protein AcV7_010278 [Taiwanofungus camphoratus]|nr:hypothetical protein AcV7_010278 [Antrodia cinnamomea]